MKKRFRLVLFSNTSSSAKEVNVSKFQIVLFSLFVLFIFSSVTGVGVNILSDYLYSFKIGLLQQERNQIRGSLHGMRQDFTQLENRLENFMRWIKNCDC